MRRAVLASLFFVLGSPAVLRAQEPRDLPGREVRRPDPARPGSCRLDLPASGTLTGRRQAGETVYHVQQVVIRCEGGAKIVADEADVYQARGESHLSGNVLFQDTVRRLTSDNAVYNSGIGRLYATGDVVYTDLSSGSSLRGPNLEYFRPMEGRPEPRLNASQRPHVSLVPEGEDSVPGETIEIDADRTTIVGETMTADGSVVIQRSDLDAWGDQARYDRISGQLDLRGNARMRGENYALEGDHIAAVMPEEGIESLTAVGDATLASEDMRVTAPELRLFFENDLLQRLVAITTTNRDSAAGSRATVTATGFRLEADSIDALMPSQQLDQVIAVGAARGERIDTVPVTAPVVVRTDTADMAAAGVETGSIAMDRDWIEGDTVIGHFAVADTTPTEPDSTPGDPEGGSDRAAEQDVQLERMVATGSARALYRVREQVEGSSGGSGPGARPALNYLSGETIELSFAEGELTVALVTGLQRGVYLDPVPPQPVSPTGEESEAVEAEPDDPVQDDAPVDIPPPGSVVGPEDRNRQ